MQTCATVAEALRMEAVVYLGVERKAEREAKVVMGVAEVELETMILMEVAGMEME